MRAERVGPFSKLVISKAPLKLTTRASDPVCINVYIFTDTHTQTQLSDRHGMHSSLGPLISGLVLRAHILDDDLSASNFCIRHSL